MLYKNQTVDLAVTSMTFEGLGVARYTDSDLQNFVVFVQGTATGDVAECTILKTEKHYAYAAVKRLKTASPFRLSGFCSAQGKCGGCAFGHVSYEHELAVKKAFVEQEFRKNFTGNTCLVEEVVPSPQETGYRNKIALPISPDGTCCFYAKRSHRPVRIPDCRLNDPAFLPIIRALEQVLTTEKIPIYNEKTHRGILRYLVLRRAHVTGEIMAVLVVTTDAFPQKDALIRALSAVPDVRSVYLNINEKRTNVILGTKCVLQFGKEKISDTLCGLSFEISPLSFYQINSPQAEAIYAAARDGLQLRKNDVLLDLCCGIGTIGLSMAKQVRSVLGIEIVPEAIADARENAARNGIRNAVFRVADASQVLKIANEKPTALVVDPPRKGLDEATVRAILELSPQRIAYISCNPSTLSRDAERLSGRYQIARIQPFDMFPRTAHVETVCLFSIRNAD